jgi:hypothetical protein
LTGAAAPAAAQTDEELLGKILAGAAILGIGAAIVDRNKDRKKDRARQQAEVTRKRSEQHRGEAWLGHDRPVIEGEIVSQYRGGPKAGRGYKKNPLPARCRVTVETPRGDRQGYASKCLDLRFKEVRHLPRQCEVLVQTSKGLRAVYGERCLDRDGWLTPQLR